MPEPDPQGGRPGIVGAAGIGRNSRMPARPVGRVMREYTTKIVGLDSHTFDVENAKYAVEFQKSLDAIAIYMQREYKGGQTLQKRSET